MFLRRRSKCLDPAPKIPDCAGSLKQRRHVWPVRVKEFQLKREQLATIKCLFFVVYFSQKTFAPNRFSQNLKCLLTVFTCASTSFTITVSRLRTNTFARSSSNSCGKSSSAIEAKSLNMMCLINACVGTKRTRFVFCTDTSKHTRKLARTRSQMRRF